MHAILFSFCFSVIEHVGYTLLYLMPKTARRQSNRMNANVLGLSVQK